MSNQSAEPDPTRPDAGAPDRGRTAPDSWTQEPHSQDAGTPPEAAHGQGQSQGWQQGGANQHQEGWPQHQQQGGWSEQGGWPPQQPQPGWPQQGNYAYGQPNPYAQQQYLQQPYAQQPYGEAGTQGWGQQPASGYPYAAPQQYPGQYQAQPYGAQQQYPAYPYGQPAAPTAGWQQSAETSTGSGRMGAIGLGLVGLGTVVAVIASYFLGRGTGDLFLQMGYDPTMTIDATDPRVVQAAEQLSPWTNAGMIATLVGIAGWVVSIVAFNRRDGRRPAGWGVVLGILAPILALVAVVVGIWPAAMALS